MDDETASEFWNPNSYYNALYAYEDLEIHKDTEEINHYIERKLSNILFPGTLQKVHGFCSGIAYGLFYQQSCYHFIYSGYEKIPMNYYIQSLF